MEENSVLFCCMGRYGDIIMNSFIANQLIEKGYSVYWLTIKFYADLIKHVSSSSKLILDEDYNEYARWAFTNTQDITEKYHDFKYYVNAQPGSCEHHDSIVKSKHSPIDFIREHVERCLNISLVSDYLKYKKLIELDKHFLFTNKPLCIISPDCVSTHKVLTPLLVEELFKKYSTDYEVKILVEDLPQAFKENLDIRKKYLWDFSFVDCLYLLKKTSFFIGNDSGIAWASLYNGNCDKMIYHSKQRIDLFHNYFNKLDSKAKDIII